MACHRAWSCPTEPSPKPRCNTKVLGPFVEVVSVDKRGRVTIPKPIRDALGLADADKLTLTFEKGELRLRPLARRSMKVRARRRWGREAFASSREAAFADGN